MSVPTIHNGRPQRRQLSDQLDRLDSIIDGLCDGLPAAVAEAAREGTRAAVKDAIIEVLANPDLRALLQGAVPVPSVPMPPIEEPAPAVPSAWLRLRTRLAAARTAVVDRCRAAKVKVVTTTRLLSAIMPLRRMVCVALGVGVVVTFIGLAAPAVVTAVIAGVGGVIAAGAAQVGTWFRRSFRSTANI